jgi:uncharacterized protein (UPF0332 family)
MIDQAKRNALITYRIRQAKEMITDVELLLEHNRLRSAINRIYYGMFYMLLAFGLKFGFETSKHQQLLGWFNKHFVHPGKIEVKYWKMLKNAFESRTEGDYTNFSEFTKEQVETMYAEMKDFIATLEHFLSAESE